MREYRENKYWNFGKENVNERSVSIFILEKKKPATCRYHQQLEPLSS